MSHYWIKFNISIVVIYLHCTLHKKVDQLYLFYSIAAEHLQLFVPVLYTRISKLETSSGKGFRGANSVLLGSLHNTLHSSPYCALARHICPEICAQTWWDDWSCWPVYSLNKISSMIWRLLRTESFVHPRDGFGHMLDLTCRSEYGEPFSTPMSSIWWTGLQYIQVYAEIHGLDCKMLKKPFIFIVLERLARVIQLPACKLSPVKLFSLISPFKIVYWFYPSCLELPFLLHPF